MVLKALSNTAGGALSPHRVQGRALVGVLRVSSPEAPEILYFMVTENGRAKIHKKTGQST